VFAQLIPRLQWSVSEMAVTVEDIAAQLPSRDIAESQRADITKFCKEFAAAMTAVRDAIRILEDKLGMHPGEQPYDPTVLNREPVITIYLISKWLGEQNDRIQVIVPRSEGGAYTLMARAAVNVAKANEEAQDVLTAIRSELSSVH